MNHPTPLWRCSGCSASRATAQAAAWLLRLNNYLAKQLPLPLTMLTRRWRGTGRWGRGRGPAAPAAAARSLRAWRSRRRCQPLRADEEREGWGRTSADGRKRDSAGAGTRCRSSAATQRPLAATPPRVCRVPPPSHPAAAPCSRVSPKARLSASPGLQQLGTKTRKGPAGLPKRSVARRVTRPPAAVMRSRSAGLRGGGQGQRGEGWRGGAACEEQAVGQAGRQAGGAGR